MPGSEQLTLTLKLIEQQQREARQYEARANQALNQFNSNIPQATASTNNTALDDESVSLTERLALIREAEAVLEQQQSEENKHRLVQPGLRAAVAFLANEDTGLSPKQIELDLKLRFDQRDLKTIAMEYEDKFNSGKQQSANLLQTPQAQLEANQPTPQPNNNNRNRPMPNNRNGILQVNMLPGNNGPNIFLQLKQGEGEKNNNYVGSAAPVLRYAREQIVRQLKKIEEERLKNEKLRAKKENLGEENEQENSEKSMLNKLKSPKPKPASAA